MGKSVKNMRESKDQIDEILEEEDDGRTIADMNVEGMPWYHRSARQDAPVIPGPGGYQQQMTDEEVRMYRWAAVRAGLILAFVFGGIFALFIAFCDFIWFK